MENSPVQVFDHSKVMFIYDGCTSSPMLSEKTPQMSFVKYAVVSALRAFYRALFGDLSNSLFVAKYRWKATREQYDAMLSNSGVSIPRFHGVFSNVHDSLGQIFDALLIIVFGSALITTVANSTTGSAAKNGNVTASPGAAAIIQLLPFIFVAIIAFSAFDLLRSKSRM